MRQGDQFLTASHQAPPAEAVKAAIEIQILEHAQLIVERELLRHVTDEAFDLFRFPDDIETRDSRRASAGFEQTAQHLDHRGFAGAVRPQKAKNGSSPYGKADIIHGGKMAEATG
jgi:hypothetical protein